MGLRSRPGTFTGAEAQKKAQPVKVALKVPPKEEVLEECAATCAAATQSNSCRNPAIMQAFTAALHHIMDF
jgi:hypothetical protein